MTISMDIFIFWLKSLEYHDNKLSFTLLLTSKSLDVLRSLLISITITLARQNHILSYN